MAKVRGPLLSLSATGQIGKSQVYGTWKGVPYARRHVIPANPRTTAQVSQRDLFKATNELFKLMGPLSQAPWIAGSNGKPLTPRNLLVKTNVPILRGDADMADWLGSPGVLGGLPLESMTPDTSVAGEITVDGVLPSAPTGWTVEAMVAQLVKDRDPAVLPSAFVQEDEDATATAGGSGSVTFTGLSASDVYAVSAWIRWAKPDGRVAYGLALTSLATVT